MRRRLRWALPLSGGVCCRGCKRELDTLGDRAAACGMSGRIKLRSRPLEKTWARILREAGAKVRENVFLRDTAVPGIAARDGRRIEVVATGLPAARGIPIAVDCTMVSPLHADGTAWAGAADTPGVSFLRAYRDKERTYPELVNSSTLHLITAAMEVGGRLCAGAHGLLESAATARAQSEPRPLRKQAARMWRTRWLALLSVAAQDALAATLVTEGSGLLDAVSAGGPVSASLWAEGAGVDGWAGAS